MQLELKNKLDHVLRKAVVRASLCEQRVKCGTKSCRCARGDLHAGYHYLFFRQAGRLKKVYVPKAQVEQVRSQIRAARLARKCTTAAHSGAMQSIRGYRNKLREINGQRFDAND